MEKCAVTGFGTLFADGVEIGKFSGTEMDTVTIDYSHMENLINAKMRFDYSIDITDSVFDLKALKRMVSGVVQFPSTTLSRHFKHVWFYGKELTGNGFVMDSERSMRTNFEQMQEAKQHNIKNQLFPHRMK